MLEKADGMGVSERWVMRAAYGVLIVPMLMFFWGWLHWYLSLPLTAGILAGWWLLDKRLAGECQVVTMDWRWLAVIGIVVLGWSYLCGQGGFFPQKNDHLCRNAIFYDLIHGAWPVSYDAFYQGKLVYYLCYWLPAAAVGKFFCLFGERAGTLAGHGALLAWTTLNLFILVLLLLGSLKQYGGKAILVTLLLLIFFSGMDYIGQIIARRSLELRHLEWWTGRWQYSSNTSQLGWVFNQAVPAWICTALALRHSKVDYYGVYVGLIIPFAPFPAIGLGVMLLAFMVWENVELLLRKQGLWEYWRRALSFPNLMVFFASSAVFGVYYLANRRMSGPESSVGGSGMAHLSHNYVLLYVLFILLEFLILALLLFRRSQKKLWFTSVATLVVLPFFKFISSDFYMRVSIPALFVLMFLTIRYLLESHPCKKREVVGYLMVCMVLLYGTVTPFVEYRNSIKRLGTLVPMRLEQIHSFAEYLPSYILARSKAAPNAQLQNFLSSAPEQTFFFRHMAPGGTKPVTTPANRGLIRLLEMSFDEKAGLKCVKYKSDKCCCVWGGQWLLFFARRDDVTVSAEYEVGEERKPLRVYAIPVKECGVVLQGLNLLSPGKRVSTVFVSCKAADGSVVEEYTVTL